MSAPQKFVDNIGRRTFDVSQYQQDAKENAPQPAADAAPAGPTLLTARTARVDLLTRVGQSIAPQAGRRAGFHCALCDCVLSDSGAYLSHINGRRHQKKAGATAMFAARATVEQVQARIQYHADRLRAAAASAGGRKESVGERLARLREEERARAEVERANKALKRKQRRQAKKGRAEGAGAGAGAGEDEEEEEEDSGLAARLAALKGDSGAGVGAGAGAGGDVDFEDDPSLYFDDDDDDDAGAGAGAGDTDTVDGMRLTPEQAAELRAAAERARGLTGEQRAAAARNAAQEREAGDED